MREREREREISEAVELRNTETKRDGSKVQKEIWKLYPSPVLSSYMYTKPLIGFDS